MWLHGIEERMYNSELGYTVLKFPFNILLLCTILAELTQFQNGNSKKWFFVGFFVKN